MLNPRKGILGLAGILIAAVIWIAVDVFGLGLRSADLRDFDPEAVARLETDMWRSYYDRRQVLLFFQLAKALRTQYHVPLLRSNVIAFRGAKAAFVFKDGKSRTDYERALPDLVKYYGWIRRTSSTAFDVNEAARLELEWWIIHRERDKYTRQDLDRSLAELQAALYNMPAEKFADHGRLRAEAMLIRDDKWASGGVSESDWVQIHELLRQSWRALWTEVNSSQLPL
jgi:hypothetical protein